MNSKNSSTRASCPPKHKGFTLIELMITVAVVGVLAAVAYPVYTDQIKKSRRAEAIAALSQMMQAQERWRANNPAYTATLSNLGTTSPTSSGYYGLTLSGASATGYTATATAQGAQTADTECATLTVAMATGTISYGYSGSGGSEKICWNK